MSVILLRHMAFFGVLTLLLAACASKPLPSPAAPKAVYKVGQPYQIAGVWYYPREQPNYDETGIASWYGAEFHGKPTANGEVYDMNALTAAHTTLPMPSNVRVTNLENGRSIVLRVNDRGPFARGRIIDVSRRGAQLLGFNIAGTAPVRVQMADAAGTGGGFVAQRPNTSLEERQMTAAAPTAGVSSQILPGSVADPKTRVTPRTQSAPPIEVGKASPPVPPTATEAKVEIRPVPPVRRIFVQAGAFLEMGNAERLRAKLASSVPGFQVSPTVVEGRPFYRVRSLPQSSVEIADATLARVITAGVPGAKIVVD